MDGSSDKHHEYYVLVESVKYSSKSSRNANVENPDYIKTQTVSASSNKIYYGTPIKEVVVKGRLKKQVGIDPMPKMGKSMSKVASTKKEEKKEEKKIFNCGEKYCIKKGDRSELIREINIRLSGFGGNVPTDEFTERTEKMIKQFQRDYMKVPETGKICGNVLKAIDEFESKYIINFDDLKCPCRRCKGFGNGKFYEQKQNPKITELRRKYEYPGIHRSLVWALRAIMFYISSYKKNLGYSVKCISSGYRCHENNKINHRNTTNHMGKAIDLHFNKNGTRTQKIEEIRDKILTPYLGARIRWGKPNKFSLEPSRKSHKREFIATTWIHYDVREFELKYLKDIFFANTMEKINGESIVAMANKTNSQTCSCMGGGISKNINTPAIVQKTIVLRLRMLKMH